MRYGSAGNTANTSGVGLDLLWENASPAASFAAQTISVDLSNYSWFAVLFRFGITSGTQDDQPLAVFPVDEVSKRLIIAASGTNRTGGRALTYSTSSKTISVGAASYNGAANNAYAIPVKIFGIRGL
jgi:hypothetical protein